MDRRCRFGQFDKSDRKKDENSADTGPGIPNGSGAPDDHLKAYTEHVSIR